jgi:hypothetical protein
VAQSEGNVSSIIDNYFARTEAGSYVGRLIGSSTRHGSQGRQVAGYAPCCAKSPFDHARKRAPFWNALYLQAKETVEISQDPQTHQRGPGGLDGNDRPSISQVPNG